MAQRSSSAVVVGLAVLVALTAAACGSGSDDTVAIGPGSDETPPVEAIAEEDDPGPEPAFVADVPDVAEPEASARERAEALDVAGSPSWLAPSDAGDESAAQRTSSIQGDYQGTMQIEIAYYDYCQTSDLTLAYAGSGTYEMPVEVYVNPPAAVSGLTERSPFNLIVSSELGQEGSILLVSGTVVTDPRDGRSALFDYWNIDQSGDDFSGVLTDRWPGVAYNQISSTSLLVPCRPELGTLASTDTIAEGAQLAGRFTDDGLQIEILAQSYDTELRFHAIVDVTQV